ncbi:hypothetical protein EV360DRAFT_76152, partial [Lentinula raphanica]
MIQISSAFIHWKLGPIPAGASKPAELFGIIQMNDGGNKGNLDRVREVLAGIEEVLSGLYSSDTAGKLKGTILRGALMAPFWYHSGTYCPSPGEVLDSVSGLLQFNDKPELQCCVREADTKRVQENKKGPEFAWLNLTFSNNGQGDPNQGKSSKKKRKRQRSPSPAPSATGPSGTAASQEPPTSSKKARSDSRAKPKPTGEKKKKSDMYHVKSTNIPEDARGIKRAFEIHIRILWGSVSEGVAPETPSNVDIANFEKKFSNASQVDEVLNQPKVSLSRESLEKIESLRQSCRLDPGTIASAIVQVSDQSLRMTFGVLSSFGLAKWRPDVL